MSSELVPLEMPPGFAVGYHGRLGSGPARDVLEYIAFVEDLALPILTGLELAKQSEVAPVRRAQARQALHSPQMDEAMKAMAAFVMGQVE